jgi:hypothetical protein
MYNLEWMDYNILMVAVEVQGFERRIVRAAAEVQGMWVKKGLFVLPLPISRHFSTVFYFSTFNLKYSEFKIQFKPNLTNCTGHTTQLQAAQHTDLYLCVGYCVKYLRPRIMHLLIIICTWTWSCMYLVMHLVLRVGIPYWVSYIDRVRHKSARIGSFSEFSIFRKFAFVFVSGFTVFAFVFVFQM